MRATTVSISIIVVLVTAAGCQAAVVRGTGSIVDAPREIPPVTDIEVRGRVDELDVIVGNPMKAYVHGDANLVDLVTTTVQGGRLLIDGDDSIRSTAGMTVHIELPSLSLLDLHGRVRTQVDGLATSGSFTLSSSDRVILRVTGSATSMSVTARDAAQIDLRELTVTDATLDVSGSTVIQAHVRGRLDGEASGAAHIVLVGRPDAIGLRTSGGADMTFEP